MNSKKAKAIRRLMYRDAPDELTQYVTDADKAERTGKWQTIFATSQRRAYIDGKKLFKQLKRR